MKPLAPVALFILCATCIASTPQEILKKRYQEYNNNLVKGNSKAMNAWLQRNCLPKFTYTSYQKNGYNRDGYISGVMQQMAQTNKVLKSTTTVRSFQVNKSSVVATVVTEFKGIVTFDTRKLVLTDSSVSYDTWILTNGDWRLQKIVQINADTQMHEEGED